MHRDRHLAQGYVKAREARDSTSSPGYPHKSIEIEENSVSEGIIRRPQHFHALADTPLQKMALEAFPPYDEDVVAKQLTRILDLQ
jgi:hypothetical protein